ncbi:YppG family protein [Virgibacillus sediminis]|uniref:YppG family protein n=1 Tax=Virgibacillus sediminis TaxID=202260 RepID=A0ABV7A1R5_9BACI
MFPYESGQRPIHPRQNWSQKPPLHRAPISMKSPIIAMFQDEEGNIDLNKIEKTARQINEIYSQVSPIILRFIKR